MKKARNWNSRPRFLFTARIRPNLFGREIILSHGQPKFYTARFQESGRKNGQMATLLWSSAANIYKDAWLSKEGPEGRL